MASTERPRLPDGPIDTPEKRRDLIAAIWWVMHNEELAQDPPRMLNELALLSRAACAALHLNAPDPIPSEPLTAHERRNYVSAVELLKMWRSMVREHPGVPRYTVTPGAGLNSLTTWTNGFLDRL